MKTKELIEVFEFRLAESIAKIQSGDLTDAGEDRAYDEIQLFEATILALKQKVDVEAYCKEVKASVRRPNNAIADISLLLEDDVKSFTYWIDGKRGGHKKADLSVVESDDEFRCKLCGGKVLRCTDFGKIEEHYVCTACGMKTDWGFKRDELEQILVSENGNVYIEYTRFPGYGSYVLTNKNGASTHGTFQTPIEDKDICFLLAITRGDDMDFCACRITAWDPESSKFVAVMGEIPEPCDTSCYDAPAFPDGLNGTFEINSSYCCSNIQRYKSNKRKL